ncbi:TolC family protein [Pseudoalteromonas espejiana]
MTRRVFFNAVLLSSSLFGAVFNSSANSVAVTNTTTLNLTDTVNYALNNEPWLSASKQKQTAAKAQSIAAGTLPDPVLSLGMQSLPVNGYAFDQENMTQLKLDISQKFSRGNSLALSQQVINEQAQQHPWLRAQRKAQVKATVMELWLNAYRAQQSIALIKQDKTLFTQLIEVTEASYSSSLGKTRQQDIIRSQLELTRLEDKLIVLAQQLDAAKQGLAQWLPMHRLQRPLSNEFKKPNPLIDFNDLAFDELIQLLMAHPAIVAIEHNVTAKVTQINLAKQSYKPQLGINMGYGYRADTQAGDSRADLLSVGVSIDLPLFTDNRQDQQVKAAIANAEATKTEKRVALQNLKGMYFKEFSQLARIEQRNALYQNTLLPQMSQQAQATLNAYTRDDGDFSDVMRARISELTAKIDALNIQIDKHIIIARLNYYAASLDTAVMAELQGDSYEY